MNAKKRWMAAGLAALLCLGMTLAGCAQEKQWSEGDLAELEKKSEGYTQDMADGDFEAVAAAVAAGSQGQLNASTLKQGWDSTTSALGTFEKIAASHAGQEGGAVAVDVNCDFTTRGVLITYTYNDKGEIAGMWMTYGPKSVETASTDAYEEQQVQVGAADAPLDGILTLPSGAESVPAVIMVAGSGAQDMDETTGAAGNKPFADIAHGLAEQGIASLRYNKRTLQYPNQPTDLSRLTIGYEVLDDAAAGIELLRQAEQVDADSIYVLGHSQGGMLAPKIAQDGGLAGLVSLAGSPRSMEDIMLDQSTAAAVEAGLSAEEQQAALAQAKALIDPARNAKEGDTSPVLNATGNYWYTFNQIDTPAITQSLSVPMLFLQGDADFQVSVENDFAAWQDLLGARQDVTFKLYEGLNHLFMPSNGARNVSEYDEKASVDPQVISDIAAWIKAQ